jgi:phasin family protein
MYQAPEQLVALNKAGLETAVKFAGVALHGAERILDLQVKVTKNAIADSVENAKAIAEAKDLQQLAAIKDSMTQPTIDKATAYARNVYDVATETQAELGRLIEEQVAQFNKQVVEALDNMVKTAPAGSEVGIAALKSGIAAVNSTYDNLAKVAKQFTEATQANLEAAAKQAVDGTRKQPAKKSS